MIKIAILAGLLFFALLMGKNSAGESDLTTFENIAIIESFD